MFSSFKDNPVEWLHSKSEQIEVEFQELPISHKWDAKPHLESGFPEV